MIYIQQTNDPRTPWEVRDDERLIARFVREREAEAYRIMKARAARSVTHQLYDFGGLTYERM